MVALSTAKMTNPEKAIYFLRLMSCLLSKVLHVYSHVEMVGNEAGDAPLLSL